MINAESITPEQTDCEKSENGWLIVCDFDGTISKIDVTDAILEKFAMPAWREIERQWQAGKIGSRQCMEKQIDLLKVSSLALNGYLDALEIDSEFPSFVRKCQSQGHQVIIVSDGVDYFIKRILWRYGLSSLPVFASHLVVLPGDEYELQFPLSSPACLTDNATCKCRVSLEKAAMRPRLLIGDGLSDTCLSVRADKVFAKDKLLDYCLTKNIRHRSCPNFTVARRLLSSLTAER